MALKNKGVIITIVVLIVLLVLAIGYIVYDRYSNYQSQKQLSVYQQGAQFGYQQAILQLMQNAPTCQPIPVTYNNQTVNLIAVECLKR